MKEKHWKNVLLTLSIEKLSLRYLLILKGDLISEFYLRCDNKSPHLLVEANTRIELGLQYIIR